jgi:hypothetical protein
MEDEKINKSFYDYLMNVNIENFDFINDRPLTEIYRDMQDVNTPIEIKFIIDMLENNELQKARKSKNLFQYFQDYICNNGYEDYKTNITKFGRALKSIKGIDKKKSSGIYYTFDKIKIKEYLENEYNYVESKKDNYEFEESDDNNDNNILDEYI